MSNQVETIVEYQLENRNKATVFWRFLLVIPAAIFACSFTQMAHWGWTSGFLVVPTVLALVFQKKYPSYVLNFNHALFELATRVAAYAMLLTDDYPTIERNPKFAILIPDVEGGAKLNRWLPLVKWILALPLYIVGIFYSLAAAGVTVIAWIVTSITGRYPEWAITIVLGTLKFWNRVYGYAVLLVTDEYPSFKL
jgi:hypothetical protein